MNVKEALERFKNSEHIVIHTPTPEIALKFIEWCKENNIYWASGISLNPNQNWDVYKEKTCYCCHQPFLTYADIDYFKSSLFSIFDLSLEDILGVNKVFEND